MFSLICRRLGKVTTRKALKFQIFSRVTNSSLGFKITRLLATKLNVPNRHLSSASTVSSASHSKPPTEDVTKITKKTLEDLKSDENQNLTIAKIYLTPISNSPSSPQTAARNGLFHAFIIMEYGMTKYIRLERLKEGVSAKFFYEETFKKETRACCKCWTHKGQIGTHELAQFMENELKTGYHLLANNCLWFCIKLMKEFSKKNEEFWVPLFINFHFKAQKFYQENPHFFEEWQNR